jgi:hypothetical protein
MSAAAFAYVLVLRGGDAKNQLMALLSQDRRAEVQTVLERVTELTPEQLRTQLKNLRDDHINRVRVNAKGRVGLQADHVSPKLYAWLTQPFSERPK